MQPSTMVHVLTLHSHVQSILSVSLPQQAPSHSSPHFLHVSAQGALSQSARDRTLS